MQCTAGCTADMCHDTTEGAWPIQIKEVGCEGVEWVYCAQEDML